MTKNKKEEHRIFNVGGKRVHIFLDKFDVQLIEKLCLSEETVIIILSSQSIFRDISSRIKWLNNPLIGNAVIMSQKKHTTFESSVREILQSKFLYALLNKKPKESELDSALKDTNKDTSNNVVTSMNTEIYEEKLTLKGYVKKFSTQHKHEPIRPLFKTRKEGHIHGSECASDCTTNDIPSSTRSYGQEETNSASSVSQQVRN